MFDIDISFKISSGPKTFHLTTKSYTDMDLNGVLWLEEQFMEIERKLLEISKAKAGKR